MDNTCSSFISGLLPDENQCQGIFQRSQLCDREFILKQYLLFWIWSILQTLLKLHKPGVAPWLSEILTIMSDVEPWCLNAETSPYWSWHIKTESMIKCQRKCFQWRYLNISVWLQWSQLAQTEEMLFWNDILNKSTYRVLNVHILWYRALWKPG